MTVQGISLSGTMLFRLAFVLSELWALTCASSGGDIGVHGLASVSRVCGSVSDEPWVLRDAALIS